MMTRERAIDALFTAYGDLEQMQDRLSGTLAQDRTGAALEAACDAVMAAVTSYRAALLSLERTAQTEPEEEDCAGADNVVYAFSARHNLSHVG